MSQLQVILASTRPGRVGLPVFNWFNAHAERHGAFEVDPVDLAELALPFMDEPKHPRLQQYEHQHTKDWSARVDAADAFVFVTPEYNHSFNAPLKNAIDFLHTEWAHKPVGFVSYGGIAAGTRAMQALKPVVGALRMTAVVEAVNIPFVAQFVGEDGEFRPNDVLDQAADAMLSELSRVEAALRSLRVSATTSAG
ncbi:NAD(P)H-dependent oxidoreductase [Solirubrobacter phytolaccae]|uniref:NAD(P)H-dependent oxidoreductase n=1 Tax=Solirubrobacter phytolaccae TaxID=1404360 RepID=A0A9X3NA39_9ACTN|nr:NAD(P)H-dependent oxidoreductase [Solirubrobacter phytolaccae]MDA0182815.1 NAD(P)H-dependent oxidoreductase [Solirubrobacter phytolaccae]